MCTLGPATDAPGVMEGMLHAGMDVARANLSHGVLTDHARRIEQVRTLSRRLGRPVGILADLPGPKYRVGSIPGGALDLRDGMRVWLAATADGASVLPFPQPELLAALRPGQGVFLADGMIRLAVTEAAAGGRVACEVTAGGTVRAGSGINVPALDLPGAVPTELDRTLLAFAAAQAVDWVGVSFVQDAADLARVRACLTAGHRPLLVAKIEKRSALAHLDAIVDAADAVMVARGDLGAETDIAQVPLLQKRIIAAANARARPVITATQMLESMVEHEWPTRAEVSDIANAVLDGTDAVMLSAESAIGRHPVAAVRMLRRVAAATLAEYAPAMARARLDARAAVPPAEALTYAAGQLAERLGARAIVAQVEDVRQAAVLARYRPRAPIVALTESEGLLQALTLVSGVMPRLGRAPAGAQAGQWLSAHALAAPGEQAVLVCASPDADSADTLRVVRVGAMLA